MNARHASRGDVVIRTLNAHQSRTFLCTHQAGRMMPLATSNHLQPTLQVISGQQEGAQVHLVSPAALPSLEAYLKTRPITEREAHAVLCQLSHALHCLHSQGCVHGGVLLAHTLYRQTPYGMPHVVLDRLYACKRVSIRSHDHYLGKHEQPE